MTDTNKASTRNLTSKEQDALKVVKGQSISDIERIIEALNKDGIIIDNRDPSFNSSIAMNYWSPKCEAYLKGEDKGDEESEKRKINYTGGTLLVGWIEKLNNYFLYNSNIYPLEKKAVEYIENITS